MKFADLHLHTVFSDGTYTPEEIISQSINAGLTAVGIVDHDTVSGILPCIQAAKAEDIEVLPGIELSAEYDGREIHILAYLLDYQDRNLLEKLDILKNRRIERVYKITGKLKDLGLNLDPKEVFDLAKEGTVGRLHVARAMVAKGLVGSVFEAFQKYIGDKCPAFVLGFKLSPEEAIKLIKEAGGIPVLAHPHTLHNDGLIIQFVGYGLMGLEVYYSEHSQGMVNFYLRMAKEYNLLVTGGSDFHGLAKPEVKIGSIKVPYELVERLKEAKAKSK